MMNATNVKKINRTNNIVNSFNRIKRFFIKNYIYIISLIVLFIGGTVLFRMHGVNFNPNASSHIDKIVTIESFSGGGEFINSVYEDATVDNPKDKEREDSNRRNHNVAKRNKNNGIARRLANPTSDDGLCKKKIHEIEEVCKTYTKKAQCTKTKCCVWAHHNRVDGDDGYECIHGDESGSTYKTKDGKQLDIDHWYYMTKCYGKNCDAEDPSTADPSTADPSTADPSTADPSTADPSTADPSTADPSTAAGTEDPPSPKNDPSK